MAAKDCWTMWSPGGPVSNFLDSGAPATSGVFHDCRDTYGEVAAATYAAVVPEAQKIRDYSEYTQTTEIFPANCVANGEYGPLRWPQAKCYYSYRHTYVRKAPPNQVSYIEGNAYFELLMTCGEKFHTTPIGQTQSTCKPIVDKVLPSPPSCGVGNPVEPLSGLKRQPENLFSWGRGHTLSATYWSNPQPPRGTLAEASANSFGRYWFSNLHRHMVTEWSPTAVNLFDRGLGLWKSFPRSGAGTDVSERDPAPKKDLYSDDWHYRDESARAIEVYRADGTLAKIAYIDGRRLDYTVVLNPAAQGFMQSKYLVSSIRDEAGRQISFQYLPVDDKYAGIQSITDPAGAVMPLAYDASGNLTSITFADGSSKQFLYETQSQPHLLTGRLDEAGGRIGTYRYDETGRAIESRSGSLNGWKVRWEDPPVVAKPTEYHDPVRDVVVREHVQNPPKKAYVTSPDGQESLWDGTVIGRSALVGSRSQPAGSGCGAATSNSQFDAAGNVIQNDDFNGNRSCMAYDATRNLELTRIEGLSTAAACAAVTPALLPAGARMVSSRWHPDWRMATRTAEPRRITTLVYNGQPDPFNGNTVANCAPADAKLPDNKPIVVLCKRVEQATTDETGALGFNATLQSAVPARATSWTYNATGQVLTETDPLNRVVVTNEYYADTTADHTKGDLKSSTNAAGHVTNFTRYDAYGKPLELVDANTSTTTYAYDLRQRLTSVTTAGATAGYDYWPTGLLKRSSQPDGSAVNYEYDDAHRLVAASDTQGNRIEYTLDQSGNRTNEVAKDPQGTLKRTMSRAFDALGRAQQSTGRE
ncbi:RHS repeat domain-containing protein [Roseateles sp. UC29_93]|uniref:RHS repeat domain-containing protein n=1 Tax=Roseateles sp. UC29_93 TaxID=3350177 RepID=UPI00366EA8C5